MSRFIPFLLLGILLSPAQAEGPPAEAPKESDTKQSAPSLEAEKTSIHLKFDDDKEIEITKIDPGLKIGCRKGRFRIAGRTTDTKWDDEGFSKSFEDPGGELEVTCNYRIVDSQPSGLIVFTLGTDLGCMQPCYNFGQQKGTFWIQTASITAPHELKVHPKGGNVPLTTMPRGSESDPFHTIKYHIHPERDTVDMWMDETLLETIVFTNKITRVDSFSFTLETPATGAHYNIRFDDFIVRHPAQKPKAPQPVKDANEKK